MMLPDNRNACFKNLLGMGSFIGAFCLLAYILHSQDMLGLEAVGIISVAGGYLLYQFILSFTARPRECAHDDEESERTPSPKNNGGPVGVTAPYLVGAICIMFCGMTWHSMALKGATRIQPLPASCSAYVNKGDWVTLNGCDEGPRGQSYRSFGIASESTCSSQNGVNVWGWEAQSPASHCRFKQRDPKSLKKILTKSTVYFVGDSITRYLYHSFCRQLGVTDSGAYDATEGKHHNVDRMVGDISVDFMWAGYATELAEAVKNITKFPLYPPKASDKKRPDLVVLGGGAWDKLWEYSTDDQKTQLRKTLDELAVEIQKLRQLKIPVVWLTPTTINTAALPSEEKRLNINEEEMEIMRTLYQSQGILSSSSFVIDGPVFTASRVAESFDGVHYPHQVYSAGAQILCNALDWLIPEPLTGEPKPPPTPGAMAHPKLGLMILCFVFFGVIGFDGFMGFSYLAAIFVPAVSPLVLHQEAFSSLHRMKNLPPMEKMHTPANSTSSVQMSTSMPTPSNSQNFDEEEAASLLGKEY
jgi:hypothetical protein